jgi:chromate transporter
LVLQFVGFMGAYREMGLWGGVAGGVLATWVTFAPCFAWIFLGAPWMEGLRENKALAGALAAVTAAVVGVILNLSIWFGIHVVFAQTVEVGRMVLPVPGSVDWVAAVLSGAALVAAFRLKLGVLPMIGIWGAAGVALHLMGVI